MDWNCIRFTKTSSFPSKEQNRVGEKKLEFSPKGLLKYISPMGLEAYKTLATALQILLTLPVSVASCERYFSKMNLI
jgi:hypothetical protein